MIDFDYLIQHKENLRLQYLTAQPFPHLVLDGICDEAKLSAMYAGVPELENKSRDYVFANNKFEKSNYKELGSYFKELNDDLQSNKMNDFLSFIACETIFVDPKNHGGGLHQGKKNSFASRSISLEISLVRQVIFCVVAQNPLRPSVCPFFGKSLRNMGHD